MQARASSAISGWSPVWAAVFEAAAALRARRAAEGRDPETGLPAHELDALPPVAFFSAPEVCTHKPCVSNEPTQASGRD